MNKTIRKFFDLKLTEKVWLRKYALLKIYNWNTARLRTQTFNFGKLQIKKFIIIFVVFGLRNA